MPKLKTLVFSLFIILAVFSGWIIYRVSEKNSLISPVLSTSWIKIADNIWFPKNDAPFLADAPEISAKAAFFIETNTGEILFEKNSREKLPVASLVKIMTAIVAMENKSLTDKFSVSTKAASMEPDKMFLIPGEELTLEELLLGVFLISANDAAEVIAEEVTSNREEFIEIMNQKALQLGLKDTNFINPTGLEEDPPGGEASGRKQLSTAYDVAVMSRYAIKRWPKLIEISRLPYVYLPRTKDHQDYEMFSGINLLTTYEGVVGFKTGYTPDAGLTLVTLARKGNKEVLGVLLNSIERRDDARVLLDYSFKKLKVI